MSAVVHFSAALFEEVAFGLEIGINSGGLSLKSAMESYCFLGQKGKSKGDLSIGLISSRGINVGWTFENGDSTLGNSGSTDSSAGKAMLFKLTIPNS
jgi:hypothetical protein